MPHDFWLRVSECMASCQRCRWEILNRDCWIVHGLYYIGSDTGYILFQVTTLLCFWQNARSCAAMFFKKFCWCILCLLRSQILQYEIYLIFNNLIPFRVKHTTSVFHIWWTETSRSKLFVRRRSDEGQRQRLDCGLETYFTNTFILILVPLITKRTLVIVAYDIVDFPILS